MALFETARDARAVAIQNLNGEPLDRFGEAGHFQPTAIQDPLALLIYNTSCR